MENFDEKINTSDTPTKPINILYNRYVMLFVSKLKKKLRERRERETMKRDRIH